MLYRFNQFIKESIQKDKIKDYFYDLIDSGVEYNFNPLLDGGFYIILFNYHNINDEEVKNGKISEPFIESLISRINDMENLNLTYSIMQRNMHSEFNKLVKDEIEKDLKINGTSNLDKRLISKVMFGTDFFMAYQEENTTERTLFEKAQADYINIDSNMYPLITSLGDNVLWAFLTEKNVIALTAPHTWERCTKSRIIIRN